MTWDDAGELFSCRHSTFLQELETGRPSATCSCRESSKDLRLWTFVTSRAGSRSLRTRNKAPLHKRFVAMVLRPWFSTTGSSSMVGRRLRCHFRLMPVHVRDDGSMFVYVWKQVFSTCCVQCTCQVECTTVALDARSKVMVDSVIDHAADGCSGGKLVHNSWPVFRV